MEFDLVRMLLSIGMSVGLSVGLLAYLLVWERLFKFQGFDTYPLRTEFYILIVTGLLAGIYGAIISLFILTFRNLFGCAFLGMCIFPMITGWGHFILTKSKNSKDNKINDQRKKD